MDLNNFFLIKIAKITTIVFTLKIFIYIGIIRVYPNLHHLLIYCYYLLISVYDTLNYKLFEHKILVIFYIHNIMNIYNILYIFILLDINGISNYALIAARSSASLIPFPDASVI